jgi:two-component system, NtrC family, sensor kinase
MTALPQDVASDVERQIAELEQKLQSGAAENARLFNETSETLARQTATSEILRVISQSPTDVQPVFDAIVLSAARLLQSMTFILRHDDGVFWNVGTATPDGLLPILNPEKVAVDPDANFPSRAIVSKKNLHLPDWSAIELPEHERKIREMYRINSALYLPLLREGECIGVLGIGRGQAGAFGESQIALAESFRDQALIAIENTRLFNETQEALERQTATSDILKVIASSPSDVQPVFEVIVERAVRLCGARMGRVYRYDDGIIRMVAGHALSAPGLSKVQQVFPRPAADDTTAGRAIQSRRPNFVSDIESDQSVPALSRQMIEALGTRSQVTVPMLRSGEPIGAITVGWADPDAYGDQQVALLQTFADQAVIAIENVRLFNETREALERQTATADILKVIASSPSDVQPVFEAIAESAKRLLGGFSTTVLRFVGDELHLVAYTPTNPAADEALKSSFPRLLAEFPTFALVRDGKTVQFADTEHESVPAANRELGRLRGFRSVLFTPLMHQGRPIGMISLTRAEPGRFADHHVQLLQTFADQAVIAIENTRLFNETKEALERQTATADILKVIASSPSDVQPVFDAIATSANRLIGGFSSTVFRFIDGVAHLKAFTPTTPAADEVLQATFPLPVADFPPFQMAQAGEVTQIPDTEALPDAILSVSRARGFRSLLFAPLMNDGVSIGIIGVARLQPGTFADHHVQLLRTFADQAVIAIENARLFDEVQERTEDLRESLQFQTATSEVLKVISRSPDTLQPVLDVIVETSRELCSSDASTIFLVRDGRFHVTALAGTEPSHLEYMRANPQPIDQPGSALARMAREKRTIHVPNVADDPELRQGTVGIGGPRTLLVAPLIHDGNVLGGIVLRQSHLKPFTSRQIEAIEVFADQAVIAISNVGLFEQVQERTRELSQSLDDLRAAQDRLVQTEKLASLGQLTAGIAHEIKNPLNFVNNFSALSAELTDELNDVLKQATLADKIREEVNELTGLLKDNLEKVVQHGKRADSIVKNMLLHSREGSGDHRPADINALIDESLNLAYHGARAEKPQFNVTLQRNFDPNAGLIEVFPQEITRVFLNLISNGFYAVTKRKADNGAGFDPVVSATTRDRGDHVEIRIRDNGIGIPPHVQEKMFNPFFTTKPAGEGTGLGLSMSHDIIVKQHGGTIDVVTEPGQFTEFTVVLPRTSNLSNKTRG